MKRDKMETYDGRVPITAPFFCCICPAGHMFWSILPEDRCQICGHFLQKCIPANKRGQPVNN